MGHPNVTNHITSVPGTDVTAYLAHWNGTDKWTYSLWAGQGDDEYVISTGTFDVDGLKGVTPEQVGRIAFILDIEYADV